MALALAMLLPSDRVQNTSCKYVIRRKAGTIQDGYMLHYISHEIDNHMVSATHFQGALVV